MDRTDEDRATTTVEQVVAILRDYGMHEPDCAYRQAQKANRYGDFYVNPDRCNCWLRP